MRAVAGSSAKKLLDKGLLERTIDAPVDQIRLAAAKLYGLGLTRSKIAAALCDKAYPQERFRDRRLTKMRSKLARWELSDEFRDMVYRHAVVKLDLASPGILQGLTRSAKRGRVDAARLALELTGRHNPKSEGGNTQIVLALGNIPRPVDLELNGQEVEEIEAGKDDADEL